MPRFAANLSTLYPEHDFLDRFGAAARDGFEAVECQFPYDWPAIEIAARLHDHGLQQVLLNAPPGDASRGERGIASLPGREAEFRAGMMRALDYAQTLACPRIHVMAGLLPDGADRALHQATYEANLAWAANEAGAAGRTVLIEPINPRDNPGYLLTRQAEAHRIAEAIDSPHLQVQMDLYHCQVVEGDLSMKLRRYLPGGRVGHLQVAGVPARQEPDVGELNVAYLFELIDELGWAGWIGCEYRPAGDTSAGLGWLPPRTGRG